MNLHNIRLKLYGTPSGPWSYAVINNQHCVVTGNNEIVARDVATKDTALFIAWSKTGVEEMLKALEKVDAECIEDLNALARELE